jgi:hypothetical protein
LYNFVITGLLTELHCGYITIIYYIKYILIIKLLLFFRYDLPLSPQNVIPFDIVAGSRKHHIHHRNGNVYFQKFFCYFDNLFGFIEKDKKQ